MRQADHKRIARVRAADFTHAYLRSHPCSVCGETDIRVLQFHHRNPSRKVMAIGAMVGKGMNVNTIREEMKKTEVMCANCHARHHHEERRVRRESGAGNRRRD